MWTSAAANGKKEVLKLGAQSLALLQRGGGHYVYQWLKTLLVLCDCK